MKHNTNIDLEQDLTLTINPDWQTSSFQISGAAETILPYAEAVQALDARIPKQRKIAHSAIEGLQSTLESKVGSFATRLSTDVRAIAYDRMHGTTMYELRRQKLADARDVKFAASIGLLSLEETFCRKHQAAADKLRR